jgi:hypothetical protein
VPSVEILANGIARRMSAEQPPIRIAAGGVAPVVDHITLLGVQVAFPAGPDQAEAHRRRLCYAAFWADARILCDSRRPMAGRLSRLAVHIYPVYTHGASGWTLGRAVQGNVQRLESRLLRNVAGVRRMASESQHDFLRRGAAAVRSVRASAHYKSLWTIVNRLSLTWAGHLARSPTNVCAAADALRFRDASWDKANDELRQAKVRRPQQSWPATYERSIVKSLGPEWATMALQPKEYARKVAALTF